MTHRSWLQLTKSPPFKFQLPFLQ